MRSKIFWQIGGVAVGAALIIWAAGSFYSTSRQAENKNQVQTVQTLKIGYRDHAGYWPAFVAKEQGFFAKNGINAELINFKSTNQLMESLIKGDVDAALGAVNTILLATLESKSPNEFEIFTIADETEDRIFSALAVKKDSSINSYNDLIGKKVSAHPGSTPKYLFKKIGENATGTGNAILAQMENNLQLQALAAGQTDAAILFEPDIATGLDKQMIKIIDQALWAKFTPDKIFPLQASVVSKKLLNKNPEAVKRLVTATNEAIDFARVNEGEAKLAIAKYTALDLAISGLVDILDTHKLKEIDSARLQAMFDLLLKDGEIKTPVQARDMILPAYDSDK